MTEVFISEENSDTVGEEETDGHMIELEAELWVVGEPPLGRLG